MPSMKINGNLTEREILLLINQSLDDLKGEVADLKSNLTTNYATKSEMTALVSAVALSATKAEVDLLRTELNPYRKAFDQMGKIVIGFIVGGLLAAIGYTQIAQ